MLERAKAKGIPNFHIFGEVANEGHNVHEQAACTRASQAFLQFSISPFVGQQSRSLAGNDGTEIFQQLIED